MKLPIKKLLSTLPLPVVILIAVVWQFYVEPSNSSSPQSGAVVQQASVGDVTHNPELLRAYQNREAKVQIKGQGRVIKLLKDDLDGSRHQRILLRVNPSQTLLIAHNIDLAPRIDNLKIGDTLDFYGEYIWNDQGGVLHWTHKDPRGRHADGWLRYKGRLYQ